MAVWNGCAGFAFYGFLRGLNEGMKEWVGVLNDGFVGMVRCAFLGLMDTWIEKRVLQSEIEYIFFLFLILNPAAGLFGHRRCIRRRQHPV